MRLRILRYTGEWFGAVITTEEVKPWDISNPRDDEENKWRTTPSTTYKYVFAFIRDVWGYQ